MRPLFSYLMQAELNLSLPPSVESTLQTHLNRQLLKFAAGRHISCPKCGTVLDCKRTVTADLHRAAPQEPDEVIRTYVACADCWDRTRPLIEEGIAAARVKCPEITARLEVVDGREVFKR